MADDTSKAEAIQSFCAVTGAEPHVAEHYLSCFDYNVERAMNFFFENPPDQGGLAGAQAPVDMTEEDARAAAAAFDDEDMGRVRFGSEAPQGGAVDLTAAGPPLASAGPRWAADAGEDEEDEEEMLRTMAAHRDAAIAAARESERMMGAMMSNFTRGMAGPAGLLGPSMLFPPNTEGVQPTLPGVGGLGVVGRGRAPHPAGSGRGVVVEEVDSDEDMEVQGGAVGHGQEDADEALARRLMAEDQAMNERARAGGAGAAAGRAEHDDEADCAALGVGRHELEEARMIEAAMLGIPYEPRLPTRGGGGSSASLASGAHPEVNDARSLRWEQDEAYEESLAADRAKAQAAEAAARAAAEAEAKERAEVEAAKRAEEEEASRVARALAQAQAELPEEPSAGEGVVTVMVRMPDGGRQGRRFRTTDPIKAIFHFVDVKHQAATLKPGSYSLVNSYPRKELPPSSSGTLGDVGITADTALFIEPHST